MYDFFKATNSGFFYPKMTNKHPNMEFFMTSIDTYENVGKLWSVFSNLLNDYESGSNNEIHQMPIISYVIAPFQGCLYFAEL